MDGWLRLARRIRKGVVNPHFSRHFNDQELGEVETSLRKLQPLVAKRDVE